MARDWRWRKASFDGAQFYVDASELPGGRRLVVHEYPGSEKHDVEDMGRKAGVFSITAYFVSETSDADSAALRARLELPGAGLLSIPMFGSRRVRAHQWTPSWSKQALNFVGFHISFVEEGTAGAPIPIGLGEAMLAQMGAGLASVLGGAVSDALIGAPQAGYLRADMAAAAADLGAAVETVRRSIVLPDDVASATRVAISDVAVSLAVGASIDPGAATATLLAQLDTIVYEQQGGDAGATLSAAMQGSLAARAAVLSQWGVSPLVSIVPLAGAVAFAAQAARVLAIADYANRRDAAAARGQIAALAGAVLPLYGALGPAATAAFDDMFGEAARHISSRILDLAPVVLVEVGASLPANVLAWRLYGDPNRARELIDRNRVATPCFMPLQFEAASS
jgi:prophage DNA circulation protein